VVDSAASAGYFDCALCIEPTYWYYRKAEKLVCGHDYGGDCIRNKQQEEICYNKQILFLLYALQIL